MMVKGMVLTEHRLEYKAQSCTDDKERLRLSQDQMQFFVYKACYMLLQCKLIDLNTLFYVQVHIVSANIFLEVCQKS